MGLMSCSHLSKLGSEILLSRFGQLDPLKTNQISISHLLTERAGTKLLFWQRRTNSYFLFFAFFSFRNMIHSFLLLRSFNLFLVHMSTFHFFFSLFHQAWMEKDHTHTSWTRHTNNTSVVCWTPKKCPQTCESNNTHVVCCTPKTLYGVPIVPALFIFYTLNYT